MENNDILVELDSIDIVNDGNLILSDVSFQLRKGQFLYIVGKVGSGKTSIIKTLIGEIPVKEGTARVGNFDLTHLKSRQLPYLRRSFGIVFQDFQLLMDMTVKENLMFVLNATGWKDRHAKEERIKEVLKDVGMTRKSHKLPHQLSGGEQQRVAIARALLNDPAILLADEPTGNLDTETTDEIMSLFIGLHEKLGTSVIMVTHNTGLLEKYPGDVFVCEDQTCHRLDENEKMEN